MMSAAAADAWLEAEGQYRAARLFVRRIFVEVVMPSSLDALFRTQSRDRDKLLARLFGIISEDVVRIWTRCEAAPYADLGRPTLRRK